MIEYRPSRSFPSDLGSNSVAALWMLVGSRRALRYVSPTGVQLVFIGILAIGANTLFSWLSAEGEGAFNGQGLVSYLLWPFLALIAGVFMAQRSGVSQIMLVPAILWLSSDILLALVQSGIQGLDQMGWLPAGIGDHMSSVFLLMFIWPNLMLLWVLARQNQWPWWERILILAGVVLTLTVWQQAVISQPIFKVEESLKTPQMTEQAFYAQPKLLRDALAAVEAGVPGQVDWYFLGVGGAGYQDVFWREVMAVRDAFDMRFGTLNRSVALINNTRMQDVLPIASRTSIAQSLSRIGQQINPDEDVLFMLLSSHGQPQVLELSNEPLALESVDPVWLRKALDDARIRWRVIVVSSCFSGSFIDSLKSKDTVVITASAPDRTSFGCTNEADYTYFGRAFFAQAMRDQTSLRAAFQQARQTVERWEQSQNMPESRPQMYIGSDIEQVLPQLEARLFPIGK